MHSPAFRRFARAFAVVLLAWTAADLFDYGLCVHSHGCVGGHAAVAFRASAQQDHDRDAGDDCFCCSRLVDVRLPFRIGNEDGAVTPVPDDPPGQPHLASLPFYHPPLA